jgi:soluble lytic murein transglycosylase-like protein
MEAALVLAQSDQIADLTPEVYRSLIVAAANRQKVDPRLVAALITIESHWHGELVGLHGEKGLMQILPETGDYLAKKAGLTHFDLADPATSVELGVLYIAELLKEYGNSVQQALAAYNGGPGAVESAATNLYARKVLKVYETVSGVSPVSTSSPEVRPQAS